MIKSKDVKMKVSVLMITYNHERFIAQAIDSILMQEVDFDYEIVIGEDCSTDNTRQIVIDYQRKHPDKIRLLLPEQNIGMHQNSIDTYNACQGQYIAPLEGDDYWVSPCKLKKQVSFLDQNLDFAICCGNYLIVQEEDPITQTIALKNQASVSTIENLLIGNFIQTGSVMYRRGLIKEFPTWFAEQGMGDWTFHILQAQYGKIKYIDEVLSAYRVHPGGVWSSKSKKYQLNETIKLFCNLKQYFDGKYDEIINQSIYYYSKQLVQLAEVEKQTSKLADDAKRAAESVQQFLIDGSEDRRTHILLYTDDYGTYGVAQHSHSMMKNFVENGYRVTCVQGYSHHNLIDERIDIGIQHIWLESSEFVHSLSNESEAKRLLQQIEPDLVLFSNCCPISNFAAKKVAVELKIPFIVVEGSAGEYLADRFASHIPELSQHYQQAQQVISVSARSLQTLQKRFGLSPNQGKFIYLGKPPQYFQPIDPVNRNRLRQELGIPDRSTICFTAARIDEAKGYQYQIAAIEQLKDTPIWDDIYFVWAGEGSFAPQLQQAIIDLGVSDRVKLLGLRSDIEICLDMADIFILPSEFEGMPHSIMEAMAKGLPVIASRVGGIPEELGNTGKLLTDPNINSQQMIAELVETLQLWVKNPELRQQIGHACKQRAIEMFTEDRMIEETIEVVRNSLSVDSLQDNLDADSAIYQLKNDIEKYHHDPTNSILRNRLVAIKQKLVNTWLNLSPPELKVAYQGLTGTQHRLLIGIDLPDSGANREITTAIDQELNHPQDINYLLARMLDRQTYQLPKECDLVSIPDWLRLDYLHYILTPPQLFTQIGEADGYYQYIKAWISYFHQQILIHKDREFWNKVAEIVTYKFNCISLYFNSHNLKDIYQQRAEIIEFHLESQGYQLDYEFPERDPARSKIRIGILASHYTPQTETFTTLPFYKNLNRDVFEIVLYTLTDSNHRLNRYCSGHADALVVLPNDLISQVKTIRADDLDFLLIATNITAVTNSIVLLSTHRLARIQCVNNSSCVTTGIKNIDYYFSGELTEINVNAQSHYNEKLVCIDGSAHCRDEGTEASSLSTIKIDRSSLGLTDQDLVYISGANFFKITPELELVWAQILVQQPQAKLVLYPFNPNWSSHYPISKFKQRIKHTFEQAGINEDRLIILDPVAGFADVKARLAIADIYLDSFPFSSINSLLDPLNIGLPVVIRDGNNFRSLMGAALMRSLDIPDLVSDSEESYIQLAIKLGNNPELRQQKGNEIEFKMQNNPSFLDSRGYSAKIGDLFRELFDKYNEDTLNQNLRLSGLNLMVFPDWNQSEESVGLELQQVIQALATRSGDRQTTLLIDTTNIAIEDAEMFISSVAMNLMMEEDIDITEELEISLIEDLSDIQWETLMPKINARIVLECDNQASIGNLPLTELSQLDLESFMRSNQVIAAN
jgi:predicted O-linked N-acetylglucosamine transferase (SPINDLY family)/glycosyltransferase involved in cell wall biosynthesis